jgi:hypothetical protein
MRPGERLLRLLWVLLLVPMLGVLGLDLQRVQYGPGESIERAAPSSLDATRREPGKVNPGGQSQKTSHGRGRGHVPALLPLQVGLALYAPEVREVMPPASCAGPHRHARRWPWQARGPPPAAV